MGKKWTKEEIEYLENAWGRVSIPRIANHLGRTVNAVLAKKSKLRLGAALKSGDYITFNQLITAITSNMNSGYYSKSWIEKRGLPVYKKRVNKRTFTVVKLNEFWEWAEKNRSFINFAEFEPFILGKEPDWVSKQRRADFGTTKGLHYVWSVEDDEMLKYLLKQQKYGYTEIAERLNRTCGAIQRRCTTLKLRDRPVRADNHGETAKWTDEKYNILKDGIVNGDSYAEIARNIGKSEKAVRDKTYVIYGTEDADKVRNIIKGAML